MRFTTSLPPTPNVLNKRLNPYPTSDDKKKFVEKVPIAFSLLFIEDL